MKSPESSLVVYCATFVLYASIASCMDHAPSDSDDSLTKETEKAVPSVATLSELPDSLQPAQFRIDIVSTKRYDKHTEIKVQDNRTGIPSSLVNKIFQPFFTTKPTGEGVGLGLSLAYDLVKAHGGEIITHTQEGESTEFIIRLPITQIYYNMS